MLPHKRDRDHLVPVADERKQAMTRPIHKMTTSAAAFIAIGDRRANGDRHACRADGRGQVTGPGR